MEQIQPNSSPRVVVETINLPARFAVTHRLLTYCLQHTRHRLAWMGQTHTDAEIDAVAAVAVSMMETLQRDLLEQVPDITTLPPEVLHNLMLRRREASKRWNAQILDDCYTRWPFLSSIELPSLRI